VDAFGEQVGQGLVDHALAGDAALPFEGVADHADGEVAFAARIVAGMAAMFLAVVDHVERGRGKGGKQPLFDFGRDRPLRSMVHRAYIAAFVTDRMRPGKDRPNARFHGRVEGAAERCEHPGCDAPGEFRAPRDPGRRAGDRPPEWRWLCLDHVRAFNAGYNYFSGMSTEEIEAAQRPFAGWERETRAFAHTGADRPPRWSDFSDPLDAIGARFRQAAPKERADGKPLSGENRRDLATLGLEPDADRKALRQRYSELVRRYHPDRNGGDRSHEAKLQQVIGAYTRLKTAPAFA
jgi:hypothetical protein